jgi:quercetin dioxygenase-like cupin family protein
MAYRNKILNNPATGQRITFLQTAAETGGRLLEMETTYRPRSDEPPLHYHPGQSEFFQVLTGEVTVRMDGLVKVYHEGEKFYIPANCVHSMWNASSAETSLNWKVVPALSTEEFFETISGLASDGKANATGKPALLQVALTARRFSSVFRLASPPYAVQQILFAALSPFARLLGYRATYEKYFD